MGACESYEEKPAPVPARTPPREVKELGLAIQFADSNFSSGRMLPAKEFNDNRKFRNMMFDAVRDPEEGSVRTPTFLASIVRKSNWRQGPALDVEDVTIHTIIEDRGGLERLELGIEDPRTGEDRTLPGEAGMRGLAGTNHGGFEGPLDEAPREGFYRLFFRGEGELSAVARVKLIIVVGAPGTGKREYKWCRVFIGAEGTTKDVYQEMTAPKCDRDRNARHRAELADIRARLYQIEQEMR